MNSSLKKFFQFPVTRIVMGIVFCLGVMIFVKTYISQPILYKLIDNRILADTIKNCISFVVILGSYKIFSKYYERKAAHELSVKYFPKELFGGIVLGFLTISLSIFILYLFGYYRIIAISTENYSLKLFTLLLVAALIEDLLIRGLAVRVLENWLGTNKTVIIAMLFETMHVFNPNSNVQSTIFDLVWGFSMTMLYVYSKRIWLPFFFHLAWNFAQPFYGSNLTGLNDMGTIIQSEFKGPVLFTGGAVGIEGSIFTGILLLIIGIVFFRLAKRKGKFLIR